MDQAANVASIGFNRATLSFTGSINVAIVLVLLCLILGLTLVRLRRRSGGTRWEVDSAEFNFPGGKVSLKPIYPSEEDRQVAFAIWTELTTRKIGLPIDLDNDVISEIYDSWYGFFGVTRDLIKSVPVGTIRSDSTRAIVNLSVDVLNLGLRPHLTRWQARFRTWYQRELAQEQGTRADPQDIQRRYPAYQALASDLQLVSAGLIAYREKLGEIVYGKDLPDSPVVS